MKIVSQDHVEELKSKKAVSARDVNINVLTSDHISDQTAHNRSEKQMQKLEKKQQKGARKRQTRHAKNTQKTSPKEHLKSNDTNIRNAEPSYIQQQIDQVTSLIRFNITFKLTLGFAFRLVFLLIFLIILVYASFSYYLFYTADSEMSTHESFVNTILLSETTSEPFYENTLFKAYLQQNELNYYIFDNQNHLIASDQPAPSMGIDSFSEPVTYDASQLPTLPEPFIKMTIATDGGTGVLVLEKDMTYAASAIEATFPLAVVFAIVLFLTVLRSVSRMATKHLKPIHIMTEDVKDMSLNDLSSRLNVSGTKDELKDLALTFNQMLDDIQKSYEREKQFVSDASHELRTPIAVIKGYAGMLNRWGKEDPDILEESIQAILGETENMHSLVESLLFIARNDKGTLKMDLSDFDFSGLVSEIVKETKLIDTKHEIEDRIMPSLMQYGSSDKLKQAIRIFIDNSIKYTPEGGKISILLNRRETKNQLIISDNGIGISKEDLPHIFERFYRADKSRTKLKATAHGGTGLGLSIAKIIIEQHGGMINVESDLNHGTTFTLILPSILSTARSNETMKKT